jgi:hypothetical protein
LSDLLPLFATAEGLRKWFDDWSSAFELGVVIGTISLAFMTYLLARRAKRELDRAERPFLYPITDHTWLEKDAPTGVRLAFRNGGSGVAKNVRGHVWWPTTDGTIADAKLVGQTLAGGDHSGIRLAYEHAGHRIGSWKKVAGYVIYHDAADKEWTTRFEYEEITGHIAGNVVEWGRSSDLKKRSYPPPEWEA